MEALPDPRRDPLTLRFRDPALERAFQAEMAASNGPQARFGAAVAIGLWLAAAFIIPAVIEIDRRLRHASSAWGWPRSTCVGVIVSRWATTLDRQQSSGSR